MAPSPEYRAGSGRVEDVETLTLGSTAEGGVEAHFAPSAGMVGCSLRHRGEQVLGTRNGLRGYLDRHSTMGIPLLYPWANRLGALQLEVAGRTVSLDPGSPRLKLDEHGLPIHGLLAAASGWRVEAHEADANGARLRAGFEFDQGSGLTSAFPFPHQLAIEVELRDATLSVTASVRASRGAPVPVAFGFHPYLQLPGVPRGEWRISAPVREHLAADTRGLPTGEREPAAVEAGPLGARTFDDGFTAAEGEPFVLEGGGRRIEVALRRGYPFAQLYAPAGEELIAFEPMTAPTNALLTGGSELRVIEAGGSFDAAFELRIADRPS